VLVVLKGFMNQRQWNAVSEVSTTALQRVTRVNLALVLVPTFVAFLVGLAVGQPFILGVLVLLASTLWVNVLNRNVESSLLGRLDLRPISETDHARLINVVDGLCVVSGDRRPPMFVVSDSYPIALAVGAPKRQGTVIVSEGLLAEMNRVEIEAVMAHVLWRMRSGNIAMTSYLIVLRTMLSKVGLRRLADGIITRLHEEKILLWADISACQATRYPPALILALQKCNRTHTLNIDPYLGPLLFVDPKTSQHDAHSGSSFPIVGFLANGVEERIAVLKEI
jgi:heat shock protein HtpX